MYIIEMQDVNVNYGRVRALDNINLKVKEKEFLGIIGPNGGGKTTLLKVLLGLIKPNSGKVKMQKDIKLGYVPQFTSFNKKFPIRVLDVILMGKLTKRMKLLHKYSKKDIQVAEQIMNKLGILEFKNRQIGQLSGGQMQKVLIARSLMIDPDILILDEPTASLDSNAKNDIYQLLKEINSEKTIIMVSHDMGIVSSYIGSIACVNKQLHYHGDDIHIDEQEIQEAYGCPIDLITHGTTPHRVLREHKGEEN
ncbi:metal ABC transporter ATP-binding protein [Sporosalibacterium faouarense]|uniref:metal ABC transporter ATP-binding protein n=1 Tax=Sporosalibacterium faouarense TaxID=516123 RepID=UPI001A9C6DFA|nr:metal ABC transporter ATP-binding protein [Sporosalibacterium faouarense]